MNKAWGIFIFSFSILALCHADDGIVKDLSKVKGIEFYRGPESGRELLKKNGFVVVPRYYHRIFTPYMDMNLPHFIHG